MENKYIIDNPKDFILAGKSNFTLENIKTNVHLTFSVTKVAEKQMYYIGVCTKYEGYMFIGCLYTNKDLTEFSFIKGKKLNPDEEQLSIKAFNYIKADYLERNIPNESMKFYHHGHCCRCGRVLTTPESIKAGIGPFCAGL